MLTRARLTDAAFDLCQHASFESITVDEIAARAGVSRMTFFRQFRTKEDVIFPDHDHLLGQLERELEQSEADPLVAVCSSARKVLAHYVDEGPRARTRYALTRSIAGLRDREIAIVHRYQSLFRRHLSARMPVADAGGRDGGTGLANIGAEIMAGAVVAANNQIIRRWLRAELDEPLTEFDKVATMIISMDWSAWQPTGITKPPRTSFVVIDSDESAAGLVARLRSVFPDA